MKFSINRVWLLLCRQWIENRQLYILGLLATAGIMSVFLLFGIKDSWGLRYGMQQMIFCIGAMGAGAVFSSTLLSQFSEKAKGIVALVLPASAFEKFAAAIIFTFVIFPVLYLITMYPVLLIIHYIDVEVMGNINALYDFKLGPDGAYFVGMYLALQSFVLLCSVIFRRYVFVKTAVLIFMIVFVGNYVNQKIANRIFQPDKTSTVNANIHYTLYKDGKITQDDYVKREITARVMSAVPYSPVRVIDEKDPFNHDYSLYVNLTGAANVLFTLLFYLSVLFLWLTTWYRLKETEL